jgi:hypothetical protein
MPEALAQKVLQIERYGTTKTKRFGIGQELTFSLKTAPREYYTREIVDLYPDVQTILFPDGAVSIHEIAAIRFVGSNRWAKALSVQLLQFAAVGILYTLIDSALYGRAPAPFQYYAVGGSIVMWAILRYLIPEKVTRMSERRRLRILDLTFYREPVGP